MASTNGITIDTTAPTAGTASDDGTHTSSTTTLSASWTGFSDATSGLAEYSYSIGTSAGGTTVRDWTSVATNTNVSATGLNLTSGTQYFINVRAKDNVGNLSTVASTNGITIDTTAPTAGTASDDGAYTGSSTTLGASWTGFSDTASGIAEYSYSIGTSAGGTTVRDWTSVATNTNVSATGLSLTSATQYFFNIRAKDNVGNLGAVASTDGITVDTTAPVTGTVSNAGATTNSSTQLTATIAGFSDALSGIARYDYSIGITAGGATVRDWTDNGAATTVTAAGLNLTDGTQYFINVRAVDNAGNTSTVASTGGVTYVADAAVPTAGTVTDDGQFTASTTTLSASWTGFSDNTAIIQYEYSIGTSAGGTTVRDWTTVPAAARAASIAVPSTSVSATGLNLTSAAQYFFNVRAKDAANNVSTAASTDGITVDTASPTTGTVSDEGTSTNNGTQLVASWTGFADALSGIARYDYSIGTSAGDASVRDWISAGTSTTVTATGLNLTDRTVTYYVNIRAVDNVNNTSTVISTDGIIYIADATAPTPGTITDDGQFTSNTTTLNASWTGFSDNTEITQYEYSIGTSAGGASVRDWTTVAGAARVVSTAPLAASLIATGLSLANGSAYFINIRAKDAAANTSTVASTDGITVDTAAPVTGTVSDEGTSTSSKTQLTATWTGFSDAVSGIAEYSYSIGTSAGDTSIKTWTSAGTAITATATGLSLTYGNTYYLNVRASDALGQLSTVASSDGIQVISVGGDMDSDGDIDKADALLANKFATGKGAPTSAQILFADVAVPKDGKITTEDANLILRCANGTIRGKAEFPWCPALAREAAALPAQGNEGGAP